MTEHLNALNLEINPYCSSFVVLPAHDGVAHNLEDIRGYKKAVWDLVDELETQISIDDEQCKKSVRSSSTDGQEFHIVHNELDRQRGTLASQMEKLKLWLKGVGPDHPNYEQSSSAVKGLREKLNKIADVDPHHLGMFHTEMVLFRSVFNMHGELVYRGLLDRAGLSAQSDKILSVAGGYWPIAVVVCETAQKAYLAALAIGLSECAGKKLEADELEAAANALGKISPTTRCFNIALLDHTETVLSLHAAGHKGPEGVVSMIGALKKGVPMCTLSGNKQYVTDLMRYLRTILEMPDDHRSAFFQNPTAQIREKGKSYYWYDLLMEIFGVKAIKQAIPNPHHSTAVDETALLYQLSADKYRIMKLFFPDAPVVCPREHRQPLKSPESLLEMFTAIILCDVIQPILKNDVGDTSEILALFMPATPVELRRSTIHPPSITKTQSQVLFVKSRAEITRGKKASIPKKQNAIYVNSLVPTGHENHEKMVRFTLRKAVGGSLTPDWQSMVNFKRHSLFVKERAETVKRVLKKTKTQSGVIALLLGSDKGGGDLRYPHPVAKPVNGEPVLHDLGKYRMRNAVRNIFDAHRSDGGCFAWVRGVSLTTDGEKAQNIVSRPGLQNQVECQMLVLDGPMCMRMVGPIRSELPTGKDMCLNIIQQFLGIPIHNHGFSYVSFVLDRAKDIQKLLTENKRENLKANIKTPLPSKIDAGPLDATEAKKKGYTGRVFGDRNLREDLTKLLGEVITNPSADDHFALKNMLPLSSSTETKRKVVKISGIGDSDEKRALSYELEKKFGGQPFDVHSSTNTSEVKLDTTRGPASEQRDDTEQVRQALDGCIKGQNVILQAKDGDMWLIGALLLSKYKYKIGNEQRYSSLGTLFVRMSAQDQILPSGEMFKEEFCNCNDLVNSIISYPEWSVIPANLRVPNFVALVLLFGGDTTSSIYRVNYQQAFEWYTSNIKFIGSLVHEATDDDKDAGWDLVISAENTERLFKVVYVSRDPSKFTEQWNGSNSIVRDEVLDSMPYSDMERTVASAYGVRLQYHMINQLDALYQRGRAMCRLYSWYCGDSLTVTPIPQYLGIEVIGRALEIPDHSSGDATRSLDSSQENEKDLVTLSEPTQNDLAHFNVSNAIPKVSPGTDPVLLFGPAGSTERTQAVCSSMINGANTTRSETKINLCSNCYEQGHSKPACTNAPKCSRCLCPVHDSSETTDEFGGCASCKENQEGSDTPLVVKKRCIARCPICKHPGTRTGHRTSKAGCVVCMKDNKGDLCSAIHAEYHSTKTHNQNGPNSGAGSSTEPTSFSRSEEEPQIETETQAANFIEVECEEQEEREAESCAEANRSVLEMIFSNTTVHDGIIEALDDNDDHMYTVATALDDLRTIPIPVLSDH